MQRLIISMLNGKKLIVDNAELVIFYCIDTYSRIQQLQRTVDDKLAASLSSSIDEPLVRVCMTNFSNLLATREDVDVGSQWISTEKVLKQLSEKVPVLVPFREYDILSFVATIDDTTTAITRVVS